MPTIIGAGQITVTDLNDAIISGTIPTNPSVGQLWVDESTTPKKLKKWDGSIWVVVGEIMDDGTGTTISDIETTLGNMANDNLLDYNERKTIKDKLSDIIGYIIADTTTTLPTTATNDAGTSGKGSFYYVRKDATMAGLSTSDSRYIAVVTQYNNLKTYLEGLTPIDAWDLRDINKGTNITVVKATFRQKWIDYYKSELDLANATAEQLKKNVDNVVVGGTNYASNGDFTRELTDALWKDFYLGQTKEIVDISTEKPPFRLAFHVKNTTNATGGIESPVIWSGASAEALVNQDVTISFWLKYSGITQGVNAWDLGRFGELIIEGEDAVGTKYYSYPRATASGVSGTTYISGTNTVWTKFSVTHKLTLPPSSTKLSKISLRHGLYACVGEFWTTGLKVEIGNKSTDWSQSPYDVDQRINNVEQKVTSDSIMSTVSSRGIEIGGRNIMTDSFLSRWVNYANSTLTRTPSDITSALKVEPVLTTTAYFGVSQATEDRTMKWEASKEYTLSFYVRGNVTNMSYTYMMRTDGTNISFPSTNTSNLVLSATDWTRISVTRSAPWTSLQGYILIGSTDVALGKWFEVQEVKVERGNKITDFSPSPEDIQSQLNDKASTQDISDSETSVRTELGSYIEQRAGEIELSVESKLTDLETNITTAYRSEISQTSQNINFDFSELSGRVDDNGEAIAEVHTYFDFSASGLNIGKSDSPLQINISNSQMDFTDNGVTVAYINGQKMYIDALDVITSLEVGNHKIEKYNNEITLIRFIG